VYLLSVLQWCMVVSVMGIDAKREKSKIGARGHTTMNEFRYLLGQYFLGCTFPTEFLLISFFKLDSDKLDAHLMLGHYLVYAFQGQ